MKTPGEQTPPGAAPSDRIGREQAPIAVAHIVESYLGLTETFIYDPLTAFRRVRPVVIARRLEHLDRFPVPPGASLHRSPPARGTASWAIATLKRLLSSADTHLQGILRREGVRIVHAHFGPTACDVLDVIERARLPLVTSFYGYDLSMKEVLAGYHERYRRLFEVGAAFLVEGSSMKGKLEALGCPSPKIRIHRIGIDLARCRVRERAAHEGDAALLMCGRMVPKKGFPIALRAVAEARSRGARLSLRLIGDGPDRPEVESLVRALSLDGAVTILGSQPREIFLEELSRADIYLQPSLTAPDGDSEGGAPTTLLEAQACGLPILTTRHADIPEIVREGASALLVEEGDVEGLAANIAALAASPGRWTPMGRAGRAHVEAEHDIHRLTASLEDLYFSAGCHAP